MESSNLFGGFRTLLPYEIELCNALGITDKEYLQFLDLTFKYHKDSRKGYELIPDIRCDPVTLVGTMTWKAFFVKVAVSVAINVALYLLTPKPKEPNAGPNLQLSGVQGRSKFNPVSGFETIQDLAVLGSFIPLVYARSPYGIRVSSQLLWSRICDTQYGQEINAICLFSQGELGQHPQLKSFALGESFLDAFPLSRFKLYFSKGGRAKNRLKGSDDHGGKAFNQTHDVRGGKEYDDNDPFMVKVLNSNGNWTWKPSFSSAKTPVSNARFGVYAPMPNGSAYKINWELLMFSEGMSRQVKDDLEIKRQKMVHFFPRYVHLLSISKPVGAGVEVGKDHDFDLIIHKEENEEAWIENINERATDRNQRWDKFSPWGSGDAKAVADSTREDTDTNMALGQQYMVGSALATVYRETDANIWTPYGVPDQFGNMQYQGKRYKMKTDEGGWMRFTNKTDALMPYESLVVQKCDIATFSNTRECDVTQIGIKSTVWRQISGNANLNEVPSRERIVSYEKDGGTISVGSISKYVTRLSFFKLQAKILNTDAEKVSWTDVCSRVFCVKGSTNQPQYNSINIKHINKKPLEYRFLPVPGNVVLNHYTDRDFYVLSYGGKLHTTSFQLRNDANVITVTASAYFHAQTETLPSRSLVGAGNGVTNNIEWVRGGLGSGYITDDSGNPVAAGTPVTAISPKSIGEDNWSAPAFDWKQDSFEPPQVTPAINNVNGEPWNRDGTNPELNDYVYWGTGPGPDPNGANYGNWGRPTVTSNSSGSYFQSSPMVRNFKGNPGTIEDGVEKTILGHNSYFSHYHGIALTETFIGGGRTRWQYWFGGTLIPVGKNPTFEVDAIDGGTYADMWTTAIEEFDKDGNPTGIWHRFRRARNPVRNGTGPDWRYQKNTDGVKVNYYAIAVQFQDRTEPEVVVTHHDVTQVGDTNGESLKITKSVKSWTNDDNQARSYTTYEIQDGYSGKGYLTGDKVQISDGSGRNFTLTAGEPFVDPDEQFDQDAGDTNFSNNSSHTTYFYDQRDTNPNNAIADYFMYDTESSSHENGSEHEITHVNEIIDEGETSATANINYEKLAIGGLRIAAGVNFNQFSSLSCHIEEGIKVQRLINDNGTDTTIDLQTGLSSYFESTDNIVEIVYDLLTNTDYGAGDIAGIKAVKVDDMQEAARYCRQNQFRWNGIIDKKFNIREFIFQNAGYCFLDFCVVGGQFSLRPSFPTIGDGGPIRYNITKSQMESEVKGLFTDGNIKDLQVTFLTPEERKMFKATVIYRQDEIDGFPENKAKTFAYRKPGLSDSEFYSNAEALPEEVFDMSGWCSNENHAKKFAAFALVTRKDVDHGISFETTPISVLKLIAGDYIRVMTEATHTSRFKNGSVDDEGNIISRETISGVQKVYYWKPETENGVQFGSFYFDGSGTTGGALKGSLFTVLDDTTEDRLYKIESITHGEEGFIKIAASHVPFDDSGYMSVLRYTNPSDSHFNSRFPELF